MKRFVLVFALVLVNLPAVHGALVQREIAREGRTVSAVVLDARRVDGTGLVDYRLPKSYDPEGRRWSARLTDTAFDQIGTDQRLPVEVVPGKPASNRPVGAAPDRLFLLVALSADGLFVLILVLAVLARRRRHAEA